MNLRPRIALFTAPFALLVVLHAACTPAELVQVVQKGSVLVEAGEKALLAQYEAEQKLCLTGPGGYVQKAECVAKVRGSEFWTFIKNAVKEYHGARCALEPHKCPPAPATSWK